MKVKINFEIPNIILKILLVISILVLFILLIIECTIFYMWLESASCEELVETIYDVGPSIAVRHSIEIQLVESECYKWLKP